MMATRSRDEILADLAAARRSAGRMTVVSFDYPKAHATINALLDELESCG